jgi:hypothetical protein
VLGGFSSATSQSCRALAASEGQHSEKGIKDFRKYNFKQYDNEENNNNFDSIDCFGNLFLYKGKSTRITNYE